MLSTARCKVQTHYGQVLAYKTPQTTEGSIYCYYFKKPKVYYCFLEEKGY